MTLRIALLSAAASLALLPYGAAADELGSTLTPFGAVKAGNADNSIPAYTGGLAAMASLPKGDEAHGVYGDPFAGEKVSARITGANMAQYAGQLTDGSKTLLQRFPDYYLNVYPTHRTASYPDWFVQNSLRNAKAATLTGPATCDGVKDSAAGVPFPVPKNGCQVLWNYNLAWRAPYQVATSGNYLVDSSGATTNLGDLTFWQVVSYLKREPTSSGSSDDGQYMIRVLYNSPPTSAGTAVLFHYPLNYADNDQLSWIFTPGQRRVRVAPEFKYDTPVAQYGGAATYDEIVMFGGQPNKFDFNLLGKKEMIVPYNAFWTVEHVSDASKVVQPHTVNPAIQRWEKHRMWVVEAKLKPGERHVDSRKMLYFDEDTWLLLAVDDYDQAGHLHRVGYYYPFIAYPDPVAPALTSYGFYELNKGSYFLTYVQTGSSGPHVMATLPPSAEFSPAALARLGAR